MVVVVSIVAGLIVEAICMCLIVSDLIDYDKDDWLL